jgi:S-(hydroxymethyl)glutathione dehydrogenase/alcohol dehydrogenase
VKTRAAVLHQPGTDWEIEELELDDPGPGQVLIRYVASGLCHSDEHVRDGTLEVRLPLIGGHEGSGIIEKVGPGVDRVAEGDHVVCSFLPSCGHCRWCATGQQQICDLGARLLEGCLPDGSYVFHGKGGDYGTMCMVGTFAERAVVSQASTVKIDDDLPLEKAALVGCGVPTGWGSAVYTAKTEPGDTIIIYGIGGIGANAVQGARHAGAVNIVAVDPLAYKRERAEELGATHSFEDPGAALAAVQEMTRGVGADKAIITVDVVTPEVVGAAFEAIRKGGDIVLTGLAKLDGLTVALPGTIMTLFRKGVKGSLFGDSNPTYDIPKILNLYRAGQIKLDELITNTYTLEQINEGYQDMRDGKNIRGLIIHATA